MASWLVRSSPERAVRVSALAARTLHVSCSWARHFTLTVPLSTHVYERVPVNFMLGVTLRWTSIPPGEWKFYWSLHATETGVNGAGLLSHLAAYFTL